MTVDAEIICLTMIGDRIASFCRKLFTYDAVFDANSEFPFEICMAGFLGLICAWDELSACPNRAENHRPQISQSIPTENAHNLNMFKWLKCDVMPFTSSSSTPTPLMDGIFGYRDCMLVSRISKNQFFLLFAFIQLVGKRDSPVLAQCGHAFQIRCIRSHGHAVCIGPLHFLPLCIYQSVLLSFLRSNVPYGSTGFSLVLVH